jgi:hypothetical protein
MGMLPDKANPTEAPISACSDAPTLINLLGKSLSIESKIP